MRSLVLAFLLTFSLFSSLAHSEAKKTEIVIGTTPGDFAELVRNGLTPVLEKQGYKVRLMEFTDYVTPNLALEEKTLDANIFQHKPYLDEFAKAKGLHLKPVAQVPTGPLGLYAGKSKSLKDIKDKAVIAIPNDPTNLSRALTLLSEQGLIKINPNANPILVGTKDITENKKKIDIKLLEAAQLPRVLDEVDFAIINGNYATNAGIALTSALAQEKSNLYINWLVVRDADVNAQYVKDLKAALNSPALKTWAKNRFKGYKFPADWK